MCGVSARPFTCHPLKDAYGLCRSLGQVPRVSVSQVLLRRAAGGLQVYYFSKGKVKPANRAYASVRNDYTINLDSGCCFKPSRLEPCPLNRHTEPACPRPCSLCGSTRSACPKP